MAGAESEWTVQTLKEHFEALRAADLVARDAALAAVQQAISKADAATEKRFEGINELRGALSDQASRLLPRAEYTAQHQSVVERLGVVSEDLNTLRAKSEGKREGVGGTGATIFQFIIGGAAVVAMVGTIITFFAGPRALPVSSPVQVVPAPGGGSIMVPARP
jgi:hypothetical protein